jgi:hypothetical protein
VHFYTDGGGSEFGHKILTGVFTAELSALFTALPHVAEVIRPPQMCLILIDSLSLIKAVLEFFFVSIG